MKQLSRILYPRKLKDAKEKVNLYTNLRNDDGKIHPRWNTIKHYGNTVVRDNLRLISDNCCCFCGCKVADSKMDVDHYLPSSQFPYLAYCWENLIPTCKQCNQTLKGDYYPDSLKDLVIIESCMTGEISHNHIYDKDKIFELAKNDRIIDPTYDNVEDHLIFNPEFFSYQAKTNIGLKTNEMFFDREEVVRDLEGISNIAKAFVKEGSPKKLLIDIINLYGSEFYYYSFYEYWQAEKEAGRLR